METGGETEGTPACLREPSPHQLGGDIGAGHGQGTGQTTTVEGGLHIYVTPAEKWHIH